MSDLLTGIISALWLGILTSISPCPLATNIAAISFIGRDVGNPRRVLITGLLYTLGRSLAYTVLGILIIYSLLNAPIISNLLQKYMNKILGPILILVGMFLIEMISLRSSGQIFSENLTNRITKMGMLGGFLLGIIFALTFCPVSAGLYFGSLFSLGVISESPIIIPAVFGVGTALPVLVFAVIIAFSANLLGKAFDKISRFEFWARRITGAVFILAGIYYTFSYIFEVI
ncbi:MAG: aromatic aminobenezylarsenical efflux permease ArsG family transporter [bacterium]